MAIKPVREGVRSYKHPDFASGERLRAIELNYEAELYKRLSAATTTAGRAQVKRWLAMVDMRLGNTAAGFATLRAVASNEEYPALERALAVQMMGEVFLNRSNRSFDFARQYLFLGTPYASMARIAGENNAAELRAGLLKLYLHAADISDLPVTHYRLAEWWAQEAGEPPLISPDALARAKYHFERANVLLEHFLASVAPEDNYMAGQALRLRGLVAARLARLTGERHYGDLAIASYVRARESLDAAMPEQFNASVIELLWADWHYAQFLASLPQTPDRTERINALLTEIVRYKDFGPGFLAQLRRLAEDASSQGLQRTRERTLSLMGYASAFDALLIDLGFNRSSR